MRSNQTSEDLNTNFLSPNLKSTFSKVKDVFENFSNDLDLVSSDIKNLENLLKNHSIPYLMMIDTGETSEYLSEYLGFFKYKGQSRLYYFSMNTNTDPSTKEVLSSLENESFFPDSISPLISTKIQIRIATFQILAQFLEGFAENITIFRKEPRKASVSTIKSISINDNFSADDIPF